MGDRPGTVGVSPVTSAQASGGVNDDERDIPAARPLPAITSAILRLASSIISSPSIAEPRFPPAGLVCGIVARRQLRRTGEGGDGLTLAAIIIGGISTTLIVVGLLLWISVLASIGNGTFSP